MLGSSEQLGFYFEGTVIASAQLLDPIGFEIETHRRKALAKLNGERQPDVTQTNDP